MAVAELPMYHYSMAKKIKRIVETSIFLVVVWLTKMSECLPYTSGDLGLIPCKAPCLKKIGCEIKLQSVHSVATDKIKV